jgi:hypothetical protein
MLSVPLLALSCPTSKSAFCEQVGQKMFSKRTRAGATQSASADFGTFPSYFRIGYIFKNYFEWISATFSIKQFPSQLK